MGMEQIRWICAQSFAVYGGSILRCPVCRIECRVKVVSGDNKDTLFFFCRNKQCAKYDPDGQYPVAQKVIEKQS